MATSSRSTLVGRRRGPWSKEQLSRRGGRFAFDDGICFSTTRHLSTRDGARGRRSQDDDSRCRDSRSGNASGQELLLEHCRRIAELSKRRSTPPLLDCARLTRRARRSHRSRAGARPRRRSRAHERQNPTRRPAPERLPSPLKIDQDRPRSTSTRSTSMRSPSIKGDQGRLSTKIDQDRPRSTRVDPADDRCPSVTNSTDTKRAGLPRASCSVRRLVVSTVPALAGSWASPSRRASRRRPSRSRWRSWFRDRCTPVA